MVDRTENFQLLKIEEGDPLSSEGRGFLERNMDVIDKALYTLHTHTHDAATPLADPTLAPVLDADTDAAGGIPAGVTVRYKYSYIDDDGLETAASPEAKVVTPSPIGPPGAPTLTVATTGGTLLAGNHIYALTAYTTTNTLETKIGPTVFTTLGGSTSEVTLTLPTLPSGATGFNVYRRAPGDSNLYFLDTIDMDVATPPTEYVDDGATTPSGTRVIPFLNSTNANNKITVTLPGATPVVPADATWRVYRTFDNNYNNSLLWHVVEETSPGSGIIVTEHVDLGEGTYVGFPLENTQIISSPAASIAGTTTVHASESARDTAYPSPTQGQFAFTTDTNRTSFYDGSNWILTGGNMPRLNITRTTNQSIADGGVTEQIDFSGSSTELVDTDDFRGSGGDTVTIPTGLGGDYMLTGNVEFANSAVGVRRLQFVISSNPTPDTAGELADFAINHEALSPTQPSLSLSKLVRLGEGATINMYAYQNSTASLNVQQAALTLHMIAHVPTLA